MAVHRWHILTGEYPPQPGGVSDYTRLVAHELVRAGDEVHLWAPECPQNNAPELGIRTHRLPGRFGPRALVTMGRTIAGANSDRLLVQYVPHAFGFKAMNLPFCYWLYARRHLNITVMFHEVAFGRRMVQPVRHNLLGEVTSLMAMMAARSAQRLFVSCLAWEEPLRALVRSTQAIQWLPLPSTILRVNDNEATEAIKARYATGGLLVGHFGTYAPSICNYLKVAIPRLLQDHRTRVVLLGRGGGLFREEMVRRSPAIAGRLHATDEMSVEDLSRHLSACDLMIQPYPDGISARRTSAMAALSHGRPVVTTVGRLTESLWTQSGAVAAVPAHDVEALAHLAMSLLESLSERQRLAVAGTELYRKRFDLRHTTKALRATDADCDSKLVQP